MTGKDLTNAINNVKSEYILDSAPKHSSNKKAKISRILSAAACLAVVLVFPILVFLNHLLQKSNAYSGVKLYSDSTILYFLDTGSDGFLYAYDTKGKEKQVAINESVNNCFFFEDYLLFTNDTGLYMQKKGSMQKKLMLQFNTLYYDKVKMINGQKLLESEVKAGCYDFCEMNGKLYFIYRAARNLCVDAHTIWGEEGWDGVYSIDKQTFEITEIKKKHFVTGYSSSMTLVPDNSNVIVSRDDSGAYGLHTFNNRLFYYTLNEIHALNNDGTDTVIYHASGKIYDLYWGEDIVYFIDYDPIIEYDPESAEANQDIYYKAYSLKEQKIISQKAASVEACEEYFMNSGCKIFDSASKMFYFQYENKIITFSWDDPLNYLVYYEFENDMSNCQINIIFIDGVMYCSFYDAAAGRNCDYHIASVEGNQIKTIIKNGNLVN